MSDSQLLPETRVLPVTAPALEEAERLLRAGQLVCFPTDTVYGVGCDLWREEALDRIFRAKDRPRELAIPILIDSLEGALVVAEQLPPAFERLAELFWPGELTVVVPRRQSVPKMLSGGRDTVAVRLPDHPVPRMLAAAMGGAFAATSANRSGHRAPTDVQGVVAELSNRVALILDGGTCRGGVASAIVDLVSDPPLLLREGGLSLDALQEVLPALRPSQR